MADPFIQSIMDTILGGVAAARSVVPGKVQSVDRAADRERDVTLLPGIGRRQGGEEVADGPVPSCPVYFPGGGGWSNTWPVGEGDECLALATDRNPERWRQNRTPGEAHSLPRAHDVSNSVILPVSITAAEGAPDDPGEDWIVSHTEGGERMRLEAGGQITITAPSGAAAATITLEAGGSITFDVGDGESVNAGGPAAKRLVTNDALVEAIDAFIATLVAAGAGAAFTGAGSAQTTWEGVKDTFSTKKAKGE